MANGASFLCSFKPFWLCFVDLLTACFVCIYAERALITSSFFFLLLFYAHQFKPLCQGDNLLHLYILQSSNWTDLFWPILRNTWPDDQALFMLSWCVCITRLTAADCVIGFNIFWASASPMNNGVLLEGRPILKAYLDRIQARPALEAALALPGKWRTQVDWRRTCFAPWISPGESWTQSCSPWQHVTRILAMDTLM